MIAALNGLSDIVRLLLDNGADLGDERQRAKVMCAVQRRGHRRVVNELAKASGAAKTKWN